MHVRFSGGRALALGVAVVVGLFGLVPAGAAAAADVTPPVLGAVSFSPASATPGQQVTLTVDATDDVAVTKVTVGLYEKSSGTYRYLVDTVEPLTVPLEVDATWANGSWSVLDIELADAAGNHAWYHRSGSYTQKPVSSTRTHTVDLKTPGFTVSGAADRTPPVLDAFSMTTAAARAGDPSTFSWTVHDTDAVAEIRLGWAAVDAQTFQDTALVTNPANSGSAAMTLPVAGRWELRYVSLTDAAGNTSRYDDDGSVSLPGPYGPRHDVDLASIRLGLAPAAPAATVLERPGRLTVVLPAGEVMQKVLSGYRVTAQPSGAVKEVAVSPTLPDSMMAVDLTGLPNGTTQTIRVTAHSTWGDSPVKAVTGRPVLSSNVHGIPAELTTTTTPDVVAQRQFGATSDGRVMIYRGSGTGGVKAGQVYRTGNWDHCQALGAIARRYDAEGHPLCRTDRLTSMARTYDEELGSRGWSGMRWVDGGYSLDANRTGDVIAVDPAGRLWMYPQSNAGVLTARRLVGTGWQSMISVISAGDLDGDRRNDIAAVDASGRLWLYPGNGAGGLTARRQIGSGWHTMGALLPLRDLDRDGRTDLGGITAGGDLRLYRGTGTGTVRAGVVIGRGWQIYF